MRDYKKLFWVVLSSVLKINIEELVKKHSVHPKVYLLEDSVTEELTRLKEQGFFLAAATNGYLKYQAPVMDTLGLSELFDFVITPEMAGYAKPDVNMLEMLQNKGRVLAHVGDRVDHDVKLAKDARISSILIFRRLPNSLKQMKPGERSQDPACLELLAERWERETKGRAGTLPAALMPDFVIYSIEELEECIDDLMKK